jgi:hypothetical protein
MRHAMVTYTVKSGREEENAALVRAATFTQPELIGDYRTFEGSTADQT